MQITPNSFKMAGFEGAKQHFPLQKIDDVVDLFRDQLNCEDDINLSLLSIVLGAVENSLTVNRSVATNRENEVKLQPIFPIIEWETIEILHTKFVTQVKSLVDLSQYPGDFATRELVKRVSDVIWGGLTRAFYKDKAHLQSLYSFLTGKQDEAETSIVCSRETENRLEKQITSVCAKISNEKYPINFKTKCTL